MQITAYLGETGLACYILEFGPHRSTGGEGVSGRATFTNVTKDGRRTDDAVEVLESAALATAVPIESL